MGRRSVDTDTDTHQARMRGTEGRGTGWWKEGEEGRRVRRRKIELNWECLKAK